MRTDDLIAAISADAASRPRRLGVAFRAALAAAAVAAGAVFAALLGPRPDALAALSTLRFPMKFALTLAFAAAAATLSLRLARPGADARAGRLALGCAAGLLTAAVAAELAATPPSSWEPRLVGVNWLVCLVNVPILSAAPLVLLLVALRRGAPDRPAALGAAAGLLAGAIGATFYAAHCPDDSPLFVAVWYTLSVGLVTAAGAAAGSRLLRW